MRAPPSPSPCPILALELNLCSSALTGESEDHTDSPLVTGLSHLGSLVIYLRCFVAGLDVCVCVCVCVCVQFTHCVMTFVQIIGATTSVGIILAILVVLAAIVVWFVITHANTSLR